MNLHDIANNIRSVMAWESHRMGAVSLGVLKSTVSGIDAYLESLTSDPSEENPSGAPWWFPERTGALWVESIREEHEEECKGLDDEEVVDAFADGRRYSTTWDHLGDALGQWEELADAYLALVEATK